MAVLTLEMVEAEELLDERCVWCEEVGARAHTRDGFCVCCGAAGHERV